MPNVWGVMHRTVIRVLVRVLLAAAVLFVLIGHSRSIQANVGRRDSIEYWTVSRLLLQRQNPYDIDHIFEVERGHGYREDQPLVLLTPPWSLFMILPLGLMNRFCFGACNSPAIRSCNLSPLPRDAAPGCGGSYVHPGAQRSLARPVFSPPFLGAIPADGFGRDLVRVVFREASSELELARARAATACSLSAHHPVCVAHG